MCAMDAFVDTPRFKFVDKKWQAVEIEVVTKTPEERAFFSTVAPARPPAEE